MSYKGMDPDEIEGLAHQLTSQANNLHSIVTRLDSLSHNMQANWQGADSDRFHDAYQNQYRPQINTAVENLQRLSQSAITQANEQRHTSA